MAKKCVARTEPHRDSLGAGARSGALTIAVLATVGLPVPGAWAQATPVVADETPVSTDKTPEQFLGLPLEELLKIRVTTASLRSQEVQEVPVTTYVVTEEDFRAYGYRDLKDVLRNLPGIEYVYPNSHLFGGQRGFSSFWEMTKKS